MNAKVFLKMLVVGVLTGVILVALAAVYGVLQSRVSYREEAVKSIAESYAGQQRLAGPVLVQPYTQLIEDVTVTDKGVRQVTPRKMDGSYLVFPKTLELHGTIRPSERHHGLYKVTVYEMEGHLEGAIEVPEGRLPGQVTYGTPYLAVSVSDVRGVVGSPSVRVNGQAMPMMTVTQARMQSWKPNLQVVLPEVAGGKTAHLNFALDLTLAGTQVLDVEPVGAANRFELTSTWPSPLFAGQFLPRTREVSPQGFHAVWEISSLAAGTQAQMNTEQAGSADMIEVSLLNPIDPYKLSDRAVKYGVLFVLLTFGGFFLFEMVKRLPIHPVQYLLVGFGLALFFLLLVSLSEHIAFASAYLVASVACIGLVTYYLCFVLRSVVYGVTFGGLLSLLYAAIYGLLISEDNALLLGSILLFVLLGGIMVATRRIDWYTQGAAVPLSPPPPPIER